MERNQVSECGLYFNTAKNTMNTRLRKLSRFISLILLLVFPSCAVNPVTGMNELMLVSEQQEIQIGLSAVPSANWEFGGPYRDAALESYLGGIVRRLWAVSERPQLPFEFHIQNSSVPNAFALPGYVAITRGLVSSMENEAQFAAVMGHEIGHVMARHTAQRISRTTLQQLGLAIGAAALEGTTGGEALLTAGSIGSSLLLLRYDRSQELQADRLGVAYMARLGYDPFAAKTAHTVLEKSVDEYLKRIGKSKGEDTFISNLLSTHPRQDVRVSEIQDMINQLPPYQIRGDGKFSSAFQSATRGIRQIDAVYHNYDRAEKSYQEKNYARAEDQLNKAISQNSRQAPFYNLLGLIKLQKKNYRAADDAFLQALRTDPGFQPSVYGRGLVYYFQKQYDQAVNEFKRSASLYPGHLPTQFGLGKSYFQMRRYAEAIPHLKVIAEAAPRHPEVHGLLGICYEMLNEIQSAVSEYRYQVQLAPDTELGRHARQRLAVLIR